MLGPKNKKGPSAHSLSAHSLPAAITGGSHYLSTNGTIIKANQLLCVFQPESFRSETKKPHEGA
jgi:hypothetical protein